MKMAEIVIGIDFNESGIRVCYKNKGDRSFFISFIGNGRILIPSLYVDEGQNIIVGRKARAYSIMMNGKDEINLYNVYRENFNKKWKCNGKILTFVEIITAILLAIKRNMVRMKICEEVSKIKTVIALPLCCNDIQINGIKQAGINAGFYILKTISRPLAIYEEDTRYSKLNEKVCIINFSKKFLEICVLEKNARSCKVLNTSYSCQLGEEIFEKKIYEYLISFVEDELALDLSNEEKSGLDYPEYYSFIGRLREEAETVKESLIDDGESEVDIEIYDLCTLYKKQNKYSYCLITDITENDLNNICKNVYDKIVLYIKIFIEKSNLEEIDRVIVMGSIPQLIKDNIKNIFYKSVINFRDEENFSTVAKTAYMIAKKEMEI